MDHAVSLVQAYLQLNGYFTTAEYPIMEMTANREFRTITDIDILAFRFPTSSHHVVMHSRPDLGISEPDPDLAIPGDRIDMIIGEVKEGKVGINSGAVDPTVLRAVMLRFGCLPGDVDEVFLGLQQRGSAVMPSGYQIRLIAFGAMPPGGAVPPCRIISLGHVLSFLQNYVRVNWAALRHCQFKDPAFGFLMTLEKAKRGGAGRRGSRGVELITGTDDSRRGPEARRSGVPGVPREPRVAKALPSNFVVGSVTDGSDDVAVPPATRPVARQRPRRAPR